MTLLWSTLRDPVTQGALIVLLFVVAGTMLLVVMAFVRRWQQHRYARYAHALQRQYRPALAALLRGDRPSAHLDTLRELPPDHLEVLLDPLFSKRKLSDVQMLRLQSVCSELGLIARWQRRLSNGSVDAASTQPKADSGNTSDPTMVRHLLRARSIQYLGKLRHRASWPLLVAALDDRQPDIPLVALRALSALDAAESFPALCQRLEAVALGRNASPPLRGLLTSMAHFSLNSAPQLTALLQHHHRRVRMYAAEIFKTMVSRESLRHPDLMLTHEMLTPALVDTLLARLVHDHSAEIRARSAEIIVFVADVRAIPALGELLQDRQWFVRLRTVRALSHLRRATMPVHLGVRACLHDPHWRVREAAIRTLIALGRPGKQQLYQHFLMSSDPVSRGQIVEAIQRTGLMAALVADYSQGSNGLNALMVERLAGNQGPQGLSNALQSLSHEHREKFFLRLRSQKGPNEPAEKPSLLEVSRTGSQPAGHTVS